MPAYGCVDLWLHEKEEQMHFEVNKFYRNRRGEVDLLLEVDTDSGYKYKCTDAGWESTSYLVDDDIIVNGQKVIMEFDPAYDIVTVQGKNFRKEFDFVTKDIRRLIVAIIQHTNAEEMQKRNGDNMTPTMVVLEDVKVDLNVNQSDPLKAKFMAVISATSDISDTINKNSSLEDTQVIKSAFIAAREAISVKSSAKPGAIMGMVRKSKWASNLVDKVSSAALDNSSIHDNINAIFGPVYVKHESLIVTGEALQKSKGQLIAQIECLNDIEAESQAVLDGYGKPEDVPMSVIDLHTRISTERREAEGLLMTTTAAVIAVQGTITSLGRDLPAFKAKLSKNSAIGSLVGDVTDLQDMIEDISILVEEVTESSSQHTYDAIEAVFDKQINNTRAIDGLVKSAKQDAVFAEMLEDKSIKLANKVISDSKQIKTIVSSNPILSAHKSMKRLS